MIPDQEDDLYLTWLYRQLAPVRFKNPTRTYWSLFRHLYSVEFVWFIPNDDNRVEDGRALREEFIDEEGVEPREEWLSMGCSVLEMLVALSRRLTFEAEGNPRAWFWHLLRNLGINEYNDAVYPEHKEEIQETIERLIWRRYRRDGQGGLFPLKRPTLNQRFVEIWYQMSAYLLGE